MVLHLTTPYGDMFNMDLKTYLSTLTLKERAALAARCGTTAAHLRNVSYGDRTCGESLAINLERESGRAITCEELRPDVDWAFLRSTPPPARQRRVARVNT
jgi:DNA-binding transcriptional regulator YdaS (Cro superfamily)